jgi:hypothetical protein
MASGVATVAVNPVTAGTFYIKAEVDGQQGDTVDLSTKDMLEVAPGVATAIKVATQKSVISNQNIAGAGTNLRIWLVDANGNTTTSDSDQTVQVSSDMIDDFATTITAGQSRVITKVGGADRPVTGAGNMMSLSITSPANTVNHSVEVVDNHVVATPEFSSAQTAGVAFKAFSSMDAMGNPITPSTVTHRVWRGDMAAMTMEDATATAGTVTFNKATHPHVTNECYLVTVDGLGQAVIDDVVASAPDIVPADAASIALQNAHHENVVAVTASGSPLTATIPAANLVTFDAFGNKTTAAISVTDAQAVNGTAVVANNDVTVTYPNGLTGTDTVTLTVDGMDPLNVNVVAGLTGWDSMGSDAFTYTFEAATPATDASFTGGFSVNGGVPMVTGTNPGGDVAAKANIQVATDHIGQPGQFFAVGAYYPPVGAPLFYYITETTAGFWDLLSPPPAYNASTTLTSSLSINIPLGPLSAGMGGLALFAPAYTVEGSNTYYFGAAVLDLN